MSASPLVSVEGLSRTYGERLALDRVSFDVAPGELFALLGPNGGGKTTLFRVLSTLIPPSEGTFRVDGLSPSVALRDVRRRLGVVFQSPSLDRKLTVLENLLVHGAVLGLGGSALGARAASLLERMDVADRARDLVETLSGGLARRVEIAKALLHEPKVLLLDEPSTGLDPLARRSLRALLAELARGGTTVLLTTHLFDEAEAAARIGILDRGRLVALGSPADLTREVGGDVVVLVAESDAEALSLAADVSASLGVAPRPRLRRRAHGEDRGPRRPFPRPRPRGLLRRPLPLPHARRPFARGRLRRPDRPPIRRARRRRGEGRVRAARALAWREVVRFLRQPSRIVGAFAPPLLAWLLLGAGFGSSFRVPGGGGASYLAYFFPGTVVLVVLFAAIFSTISVIEDRREGFLQAVVVSPVSPLSVAFGKIAGGTLLALVAGGRAPPPRPRPRLRPVGRRARAGPPRPRARRPRPHGARPRHRLARSSRRRASTPS